MALDSARQTYCPDCAWTRRQRSNLEANRRRRQADRDRRLQSRTPAPAPGGGLVLPPETVRLLTLRLDALREVVEDWRQGWQHLMDLREADLPAGGMTEWDLDMQRAEIDHSENSHLAGLVADEFIAAADLLLPAEILEP